MESLYTFLDFFLQLGKGPFVILGVMFVIASVGQWMMYEKAHQPGYAIFVPVWNLIAFLKIVGRPAHHIFFFFIPGYNLYFVVKVWIEICQSFGRYSLLDYIGITLLNGLYLVNLGLSPDIRYVGPAYRIKEDNRRGRLFIFPDDSSPHHQVA